MFLLVPAHPVCPGQNPEIRKTVVVCSSSLCKRLLNYIHCVPQKTKDKTHDSNFVYS